MQRLCVILSVFKTQEVRQSFRFSVLAGRIDRKKLNDER